MLELSAPYDVFGDRLEADVFQRVRHPAETGQALRAEAATQPLQKDLGERSGQRWALVGMAWGDDQRPVVRRGALGEPAQLVAVDGRGEREEAARLRPDSKRLELREFLP